MSNTIETTRVEVMIDDQLYTFHGTIDAGHDLAISYYNCTHSQLLRHLNIIRQAFIKELIK